MKSPVKMVSLRIDVRLLAMLAKHYNSQSVADCVRSTVMEHVQHLIESHKLESTVMELEEAQIFIRTLTDKPESNFDFVSELFKTSKLSKLDEMMKGAADAPISE